MAMTFIPVGVGDAFSALHYSSAVAVEADGRWLLVDCPHPLRKILREASARAGVDLDAGSFEAVVVTHLHADHCAGLEGLGYFGRFALGAPPRLAAHPAVLERLWDGRLAAGMDELSSEGAQAPPPRRAELVGAPPGLADPATWRTTRMTLADYFEVAPLDDARPVEVGPFTVECRRTRHHVPTYALRVRGGGRTLGLSADTTFDPGLVEWLAEADLVIHETGPGIHASYERLAALPAPLRARMRLIHYPDAFVPDGAIEPLVEGRRYTV